MSRKVSLITMGSFNPVVLKKTLDSFVGSGICSEVIFGDMTIFKDDTELIKSYQEEYNMTIVPLPFDYIFKNGFSSVLNKLIEYADNPLTLYMNISEVIDEDYGINNIVDNNKDCNTFYFTHRQENHRWFRMNDRDYLKWSGNIHEESTGDFKPYHKPIFMMKDLEKDLHNPFKAKCANDFKECVYFQQYLNLIDFPEKQGETNDGWIPFAKDNYDSMKERLLKKGARYEAFQEGNLEKYMNDVMTNPEFEKERFESSNMIEFQGDPKFLGK